MSTKFNNHAAGMKPSARVTRPTQVDWYTQRLMNLRDKFWGDIKGDSEVDLATIEATIEKFANDQRSAEFVAALSRFGTNTLSSVSSLLAKAKAINQHQMKQNNASSMAATNTPSKDVKWNQWEHCSMSFRNHKELKGILYHNFFDGASFKPLRDRAVVARLIGDIADKVITLNKASVANIWISPMDAKVAANVFFEEYDKQIFVEPVSIASNCLNQFYFTMDYRMFLVQIYC